MATGTEAVSLFGKRLRATVAAICASSLPALDRTCSARVSLLAATAGKSAAKSGGGVELAARARSESERTPQIFWRAAESELGDSFAKISSWRRADLESVG